MRQLAEKALRPPLLPEESPVSVRGAIQFDLASEISGRTYRVFVFEPAVPPPPAGYPLVIALDGNLTFPLLATMDGAFALGGGRTALVVGVGYPTDDPAELFRLRTPDLTAPGAEAFRRFLAEELRPAIDAAFCVDPDDQTLYGHSMGGLFVLDALFNDPDAFGGYVASSPSIWWNERAVLAAEPAFADQVCAGRTVPRVLITVGSKETDPPQARMVENAHELAMRLARLDGGPGYMASFHAFEGEDHLTALPASVGRALAFALR
jgi:predicted alpha/beta superfamily hydrolase